MNFVLNVVIKASIILSLAALVCLLLRRASASTRHTVWLIAIVCAVLLPIAVSVVPPLQLPTVPEDMITVRFFLTDGIERGLKPSTTGAAETLCEACSRRLQPAFIWLIGVAVLLVRLFLGTISVRRMALRAKPNADQTWNDLIANLSRALDIKRPVRLLFSDSNISPMTWGVLRHAVVLPASARVWTNERRRLVLAHELAHVRRNDGIIQIFVQFVCSVYWFNPLVWFAAHRLRIERERACDDQVLNLGAAGTDYAAHLVEIVRGMKTRRSLSFAALSMAQPSQLETRLISILDPRARRNGLSKAGAAALYAAAGLLTISLAAIGITAKPLPQPPAPLPGPVAAQPQRTRIGDPSPEQNTTIVPPQVIASKPPIYTDEAIAARIEGIVTLEVDVDAKGQFKILRVVKGLGAGLDQRAIGTVIDWKFAPATRNGVPVRAVTQVDVDFKLPNRNPGTFRVGGGVSAPTVLSRVEPQYSPEAKEARLQGTVVLEIIIRRDGTVDVLRVVRGLGSGLDESAVAALKQWRFKPGMKDGKPVDVALNVEVNFNLR